MRYTQGWVKSHRKYDSHPLISENLIIEGLWAKLNKMANFQHGTSPVMHNGRLFFLERGQLITSIKELNGKTGLNRSVIERSLNLMCSAHLLSQKVSNDGRVITICNYEEDQDCDTVQQQRSSNGPATVQQHNSNAPAYSKELKKLRSKELKNSPSACKESDKVIEIWNKACEGSGLPKILRKTPTRLKVISARLKEEPDLAKWEKAIALLHGSPHHCGKNDRRWVADIDFFLRESQFTKWLEKACQEPSSGAKSANAATIAKLKEHSLRANQL